MKQLDLQFDSSNVEITGELQLNKMTDFSKHQPLPHPPPSPPPRVTPVIPDKSNSKKNLNSSKSYFKSPHQLLPHLLYLIQLNINQHHQFGQMQHDKVLIVYLIIFPFVY
jgi:hypothetical protein